MKKIFKTLMRRQLQETIDMFSALVLVQPPVGGWLKNIRESLNMPQDAFAKKLECSKTNAINLENREMLGNITLNKLAEAAAALDCKLVYGLVPLKNLNELIEAQAIKVAQQKLKEINHTMALEQQSLTDKQLKNEQADMVKEIIAGSGKELWSVQ